MNVPLEKNSNVRTLYRTLHSPTKIYQGLSNCKRGEDETMSFHAPAEWGYTDHSKLNRARARKFPL